MSLTVGPANSPYSISFTQVETDISVVDGGQVYVLSGGSAYDAVVSSNGFMAVENGGLASGVTVASGGVLEYAGSAPVADNIDFLPGATVEFGSGYVDYGSVISSGITVVVLSGGTESSGMISGGAAVIYAGGSAVDLAISGEGVASISGGSAVAANVQSGGVIAVYAGGSDSGATLSSGAIEYVSSGGEARDTAVSGGADVEVLSGGAAVSTNIGSGGVQFDLGGSTQDVVVESGGYQYIESGGTANDTKILAGGSLFVVSGVASGTTVKDNGYAVIEGGGSAVGLTVSSDGNAIFTRGAKLTGDVVDGGVIKVASADVVSGTLDFGIGGGLNFGSSVVTGLSLSGTQLSITVDGVIYHYSVSALPPDTELQIQDNGHSVVLAAIDPLTVGGAGNTISYAHGAPASVVDANLDLNDSSNTTIASASVTIAGGFISGDILAANTSGTTLSALYDGATGVLTISGTATIADYEKVLQSVAYSASRLDPTNGGSDLTRTIVWTVDDGPNVAGDVATTIDLIQSEAPPIITAVGNAVQYVQGIDLSALLNANLTLQDSNGSTLVSATVSIGSGFLAGDVLSANTGGTEIAASYDGVSGVLTLTGTADLSTYQQVLDSVSIATKSVDATGGGKDPSRTITWQISDGVEDSAPVTTTVDAAISSQLALLNSATIDSSRNLASAAKDGLSTGQILADAANLYAAAIVDGGAAIGGAIAQNAYGSVLSVTSTFTSAVQFGGQIANVSDQLVDGVTSATLGPLNPALQQEFGDAVAAANELYGVVTSGGSALEVASSTLNLYNPVLAGVIGATATDAHDAYVRISGAAGILANEIVVSGTQAQIEAAVSDLYSTIEENVGATNSAWQTAYASSIQLADALSVVVSGGTAAQVTSATTTLYDSVLSGALQAVGGTAWAGVASETIQATNSLAAAIGSGASLSAILADESDLIDTGISQALGAVGGPRYAQAFDDVVQAADTLQSVISGGFSGGDIEVAAGDFLNAGVSGLIGAVGGPELQQAYEYATEGAAQLGSDISAFAAGDPTQLLLDALNIYAGVSTGDVQAALQIETDIENAIDYIPDVVSTIDTLFDDGISAFDGDTVSEVVDLFGGFGLPDFVGYNSAFPGMLVPWTVFSFPFYSPIFATYGVTEEHGGKLIVLPVGFAFSTTVGNGGELDVEAAGLSFGARISGGVEKIEAGGSDSDAVIVGGKQFVNGAAEGAIIGADGYQEIDASGQANNASVYTHGVQAVYSDGLANRTAILGGMQHVYGEADYDDISAGAEYVHSGGQDVNAFDAGYQEIELGGSALFTSIDHAGNQTVNAGGFALGAILVGGRQSIFGSAIATTISSGLQIVESGGTVSQTKVSGGEQDVYGSAVDTMIYSGGIQKVFLGGTTSTTYVSSGSTQIVSGTADGTNIISGQEFVFGSDSNAVVSGGTQVVEATGTASSGIIANVYSDQDVYGTASATRVEFGFQEIESGGAANNTVVVNGTQFVKGGATASGTNVVGANYYSNSPLPILLEHNSPYTYPSQFVSSGGTVVDTTVSGSLQLVLGDASGTTLTNAEQFIGSGGKVVDTTVDRQSYQWNFGGTAIGTVLQGSEQVISGGSATSTTLLEFAEFPLQVVSGGSVVSHTVVSAGGQLLYGASIAYDTILLGGSVGAEQQLEAGCSAIGTEVGSSGTQYVDSGAIAFDTTIESGGVQYLRSVAVNTVINGGVQQAAQLGAIASGTIINSGGVQRDNLFDLLAIETTVNSGGLQEVVSASETTVYAGGKQLATWASSTSVSGGIQDVQHYAEKTSVYAGSQLVERVGSAADAVIFGDDDQRGTQDVYGIANGTQLSGGLLLVESTGLATNADLFNEGELRVSKGGGVDSSTVLSGGSAVISSGGIGNNTVVSRGGTFYVAGSAQLTSIVGGEEIVSVGGSDDVDLISGGAEYVYGSVNRTTIEAGSQIIENGGSAYDSTIDRGRLEVMSGGTVAWIEFEGATGTLQIDNPTASGPLLTYSRAPGSAPVDTFISGFVPGDTIDLKGVQYTGLGHVDINSSDVLTITDGGSSYSLQLAGSVFGRYFHLIADSPDPVAGTAIVEDSIPSPVSGLAEDGYLSGATVFADANRDGIWEPGEATTLTDSVGAFTLPAGSAPFVLTGGTDNFSHLAFKGTLSAPNGYSVITFLSSLVSRLSVAEPSATLTQVEDSILSAFGVTLAAGETLGSLDPIAGTLAGDVSAQAAFVANTEIGDTVDLIASYLARSTGASLTDAASAVLDALASSISGLPLDLIDPTTIAGVLADADSTLDPDGKHTLDPISATEVVSLIVASNSALLQEVGKAVDGVAVLRNASAVGLVAQGTTSADLQSSTPITSIYDNFTGTALDLAINAAEQDVSIPCYCCGTLILTDAGERPVETLKIGDKLKTASGALRPIKWIGRRSYFGPFIAGSKDVLPIRFSAGSIEDGLPRRDLWISPHHAMYFQGVLIEAKDLVNGVSVAQQEAVSVVEYFHVELETHDVIFAEGTLSETFVDMDNRGMFQNAHEYAATCPARTTSEPEYYAPRLDHGYEVESVRRYLERRAGLTTIGGTKGELRGYVDCICSNSISGWAQNTDYPEAPVCLDVYVGGCLVGQALANLYREDLMRAGVGSGHHAFTLEVPAKLSRSDTVQVRRSIDGTLLNRSQKNTHFI